MAKQTQGKYTVKPRVKRPGIHAKTKQTFTKGASQYIKRNVGQGQH